MTSAAWFRNELPESRSRPEAPRDADLARDRRPERSRQARDEDRSRAYAGRERGFRDRDRDRSPILSSRRYGRSRSPRPAERGGETMFRRPYVAVGILASLQIDICISMPPSLYGKVASLTMCSSDCALRPLCWYSCKLRCSAFSGACLSVMFVTCLHSYSCASSVTEESPWSAVSHHAEMLI